MHCILLANNVDLDQMPNYMASDLGLHCLPMIFLQVSREGWVNIPLKHIWDLGFESSQKDWIIGD